MHLQTGACGDPLGKCHVTVLGARIKGDPPWFLEAFAITQTRSYERLSEIRGSRNEAGGRFKEY